MNNRNNDYDVIIIGAGASGTALLYALSRYTNIRKIALVEKYERPGQVNSKATNNSQTLHVGDIETNYSFEKVKQVKPASMMVVYYADQLTSAEKSKFLFSVSKMVLGVGDTEVAVLEKRYEELKTLFPDLKKLYWDDIAKIEPAIVAGRKQGPLIALHTNKGFGVDFEMLSESFIEQAIKAKSDATVLFNHQVQSIIKNEYGGYTLSFKDKTSITASVVIVDADSYSLLFAKQLGYGKHYSLIPIAGTFYFSHEILHGKVYTVQEPKLPFAAVHGDPDVRVPGVTRWGPTARFHPVLESRKFSTSMDFLKSSGLNKPRTWISFIKILFDPIRFVYLLENMLYELPWVGKRLFLKNIRKIVPSIRASEIYTAKGYGGMRLQRVDTNTHELQLGEGKIIGDNIIFNMTPSPGASVCLYNALRDVEHIIKFLGGPNSFDKERMEKDLVCTSDLAERAPVSLPEGYAS